MPGTPLPAVLLPEGAEERGPCLAVLEQFFSGALAAQGTQQGGNVVFHHGEVGGRRTAAC